MNLLLYYYVSLSQKDTRMDMYCFGVANYNSINNSYQVHVMSFIIIYTLLGIDAPKGPIRHSLQNIYVTSI